MDIPNYINQDDDDDDEDNNNKKTNNSVKRILSSDLIQFRFPTPPLQISEFNPGSKPHSISHDNLTIHLINLNPKDKEKKKKKKGGGECGS